MFRMLRRFKCLMFRAVMVNRTPVRVVISIQFTRIDSDQAVMRDLSKAQ